MRPVSATATNAAPFRGLREAPCQGPACNPCPRWPHSCPQGPTIPRMFCVSLSQRGCGGLPRQMVAGVRRGSGPWEVVRGPSGDHGAEFLPLAEGPTQLWQKAVDPCFTLLIVRLGLSGVSVPHSWHGTIWVSSPASLTTRTSQLPVTPPCPSRLPPAAPGPCLLQVCLHLCWDGPLRTLGPVSLTAQQGVEAPVLVPENEGLSGH